MPEHEIYQELPYQSTQPFQASQILQEDYLFYYLKSQTKLFYDLGTGTTIKYISRTKFENLIIPLPPKNEQCRIVAKIEKLFALLDDIKESLEA